jgi:hypothetical protein
VDGGINLVVSEPGTDPTSSQTTAAPDFQGVDVQYSGACQDCAFQMVCPVIPSAQHDYATSGYSCLAVQPQSESVVYTDGAQGGVNGIAEIEDPPGVKGDSVPSGGTYSTKSALHYTSPAAGEGGASEETCVLPDSGKPLCTAILNDFNTRSWPSTTGAASPPTVPATTTTTTSTSGATWANPQLTITADSLGAVRVGMTMDQAQAAAGLIFDGMGDGMYYPTTTPDHVYAGFVNSTPTVSCVGAALGQSSGTQTVSTPEGFQLGGSVQTLISTYGSSARYVPAPATGGIDPRAGYIVAENGGNLFFYIDQTNATVDQIAGGPNVTDGNSCSG